MRRFIQLSLIAVGVMVAPSYGAFMCVENNSGVCATYAPNLSATSSGGGSTLTISFASGGTYTGAIDIIYLDPVNAVTFSTLTQSSASAGVGFSGTGNPANMPGANNAVPAFVSAINIASTSNANRINPGESIVLAATGPGGAINIGTLFDQDLLRIGIHIQSISGGNITSNPSDTLILTTGGTTSNSVPEPSTFGFVGMGLVALGLIRRKRA